MPEDNTVDFASLCKELSARVMHRKSRLQIFCMPT